MRTWVFLRGLIRHKGHWDKFVPTFQEFFPEDKIICLDILGNGSESERASSLHLADYIDDLRRQMRDRLSQDTPRLHLLGVSLGGMIALEWQMRFPEQAPVVVAINSSSNLSAFWKRFSLRVAAQLPKLVFAPPPARDLEREILKTTAPTFQISDDFLSGALRFPPTTGGNLLRQMWAARQFHPRQVGGARQLFLAGENDALVDPECSRALARFYEAPCFLCPEGVHDLPLTHGPWICEQIQKSLGE